MVEEREQQSAFERDVDLLAFALDELAQGREPMVAALAGGDEELERRLAEGLRLARRLSPELEERAFPACVGPYVIERELGRGGMGRVLLGRHPELGVRLTPGKPSP